MYASKFATVASKLFELVANCSEQTAIQNTNIAAEVSKVARKRTSGLTVMSCQILLLFHKQNQGNLEGESTGSN